MRKMSVGQEATGPTRGEVKREPMSFVTLKAMMRMMPGMEAMRISQRHPMVGTTTEARPMMSREPASQKTWGREGRLKPSYFPIVTCGCQSWTIKKPECQRINAFDLCVGEDS